MSSPKILPVLRDDMTSAKKIVRLHPAILTVVLVVLIAAMTIFTVEEKDPLSYIVFASFINFFAVAVMVGWQWALSVVSSEKEGRRRLPRYIFFFPPIFIGIGRLFSVPLLDNAAINGWLYFISNIVFFLGVFSYVYIIWKVAESIEYADRKQYIVTAGSVFKTFMMLFYTIIGVWVMRSRILRIASEAGGAL